MIIFTTLDNNYEGIWEKSGEATFSSQYELLEIVKKIESEVQNKKIYAIGLYRMLKTSRQPYQPSLLCIKKVTILNPKNIYLNSKDTHEHDIIIYFDFVKKLSSALDNILKEIFIKPTPLIRQISDRQVIKILESVR